MRTMAAAMAALAIMGLAGCGLFRRSPPVPAATAVYTLGRAYQAGGTWFYPRESFDYDETGLADVQAGRGLTADGELADPGAMTAAHQTLQLPAIVRVTNLENGRSAMVRVNDRGPADPGRIIALSPTSAEVLGAGAGTRVRVRVEAAMSHALAASLQGGPALAISAAPLEAIRSESLAPPAGAVASARVRTAAGLGSGPGPGLDRPGAAPSAAPGRLPMTAEQGAASPGQLYVRASEFSRNDYAEQERVKLSGLPVAIERVHAPRQDRFRVRAGPFASVAAADAALRQAARAGVPDARIVVE